MAIQEVRTETVMKKPKNQLTQETAKTIDCLKIKEKEEQLRDTMHSKRRPKKLFRLLIVKQMNNTWDLDSWTETYPENLQHPNCSYCVTRKQQTNSTLFYFKNRTIKYT